MRSSGDASAWPICGARQPRAGRRARVARRPRGRVRARASPPTRRGARLDAPVRDAHAAVGRATIYNAGDDVPPRVAAAVPADGRVGAGRRARSDCAAPRWAGRHRHAEAAGRLCRDAGPAGLAFFPNRFLA